MEVARLIACGIGPTQAKLFADPLAAACSRFGIGTPVRQAAFLAQCMHESQRFTAMEESLFYRDPARLASVFKSAFHGSAAAAAPYVRSPQALANKVYAARNGNGDEASGDGWAYRGSGPLQLTGRANFHDAASGTGLDLERNPDLVRRSPGAGCMAAAWFFAIRGCLAPADNIDIDGVTRIVNPAMLGRTERANYFRECLEALR